MATEFVSNFSWHTAAAIAIALVASFGLRYLLKKRHPSEFEALRFEGVLINQQENMSVWGKGNTWLKPDNSKHHFLASLNKWIFTLGFLKLNDLPFSVYCFFTLASYVAAIYFVLTEPIFAEWTSTW